MDDNRHIESLDLFIFRWNADNPIDRWYRKRYQLPFNSNAHRVVSVYDQAMEYREEHLFGKMFSQINNDEYSPGEDIWKPITQEERDEVLSRMDVDSFLDAFENK